MTVSDYEIPTRFKYPNKKSVIVAISSLKTFIHLEPSEGKEHTQTHFVWTCSKIVCLNINLMNVKDFLQTINSFSTF